MLPPARRPGRGRASAREVLPLAGALVAELPDDLFPQACRFGEHVVEPLEHLPELVRADGAFVRHGFRQDYSGSSLLID
jgi:hypothetical protein